MSLKRIQQTLKDLGLTKTDAKIYIYLSKKGPKKFQEIANDLQITKQQLTTRLTNLKETGIITANPQQCTKYQAITFEKAIDLLIKTKIEQAQNITENKNQIIKKWTKNQLENQNQTTGDQIN